MQGGPSRIRVSSLPLTPPVSGTLVDQNGRSPQTRAHDTQRIGSLQYFARRAAGPPPPGPWGDGRGTGGWERGAHDRRSRGQPFSFLVRLCNETGGMLLTQG